MPTDVYGGYNDSVGARRIAIIYVVGQAWVWLHHERHQRIVKSFEQTGIPLPPDGRKQICGLSDFKVNDLEVVEDRYVHSSSLLVPLHQART